MAGLINLLDRLKCFLRMNRKHVSIKMHRTVCHVFAQFAQKLQLVWVLLQAAVHYLFVVHILHVAVQVGSAGQCLVTFRAVVFDVEVNAFLMHLHVPFLVGFVLTVVKVTVVFANCLGNFLLALPSLQELDVVPPKFSIVVKTFLTILTLEVFHPIVDDLLMLSKVGKILVANVAEFFLRVLDCVDGLVVSIKIRLLGERLAAKVAGKQNRLRTRFHGVLAFHVLFKVGEFFVTNVANLFNPQVHQALVPETQY